MRCGGGENRRLQVSREEVCPSGKIQEAFLQAVAHKMVSLGQNKVSPRKL